MVTKLTWIKPPRDRPAYRLALKLAAMAANPVFWPLALPSMACLTAAFAASSSELREQDSNLPRLLLEDRHG
jgi:hypothetical protein